MDYSMLLNGMMRLLPLYLDSLHAQISIHFIKERDVYRKEELV